jgi:hypothetical protein
MVLFCCRIPVEHFVVTHYMSKMIAVTRLAGVASTVERGRSETRGSDAIPHRATLTQDVVKG